MNNTLRSILFLSLIIAGVPAMAQDSLRQVGDTTQVDPSDSVTMKKNGKTVTIESYAARYSPRRAMLLSAVFPGAGQAYNKKYWKMPLVYGGFVGLGYGIWFNQQQYLKARKGLFSLLNEPATPIADPTTGLTPFGNKVVNGKVYYPIGSTGLLGLDAARNYVNKYRRDRDYLTIMSFLLYLLQMVDAHVDAHLKEFDLNPQLKVSIEPNSIIFRF
jgi:hypothetical protein